ncbi:MAG: DegT/DnrJ/EryC1/StrS family aminotransferase [Nitrospirae bacterium]|nr:DegT/DnrJ/EryC1/StrS family aminotransferase [Nitrospirota bacterium]
MQQHETLALFNGKPVRDRMLVFQQPELDDNEINEVIDSLKSGWLGTGPKVGRFVNDFLSYKKAKYGLALNSCTAGLFLSLKVLGIKENDEVITTPLTFGATANVIEQIGAKTVFADCHSRDFNIIPEKIKGKITNNTKALIIVHFAGRPCNMKEIVNICKEHDIALIEDCAHAVEAYYGNRSVGTFGAIGCFSFYATKNLFTGEGGMFITNIKKLYNLANVLSNHGMSKDAWKRFTDKGFRHYKIVSPGYKMNMMDIQACIGIHQLNKIEDNWKKRREIWYFYNEKLKDYPCETPLDEEPGTRHSYHLYSVLLNIKQLKCSRDTFMNALQKENIGVGVHYIPLHIHPYYKNKYGFKASDYPNANYIGRRTLSFNLKPTLKREELNDIINAFDKVCNYFKK